MKAARRVVGIGWLIALVLAFVFRGEAASALPAVLAGGVVLLASGFVALQVEKRRS